MKKILQVLSNLFTVTVLGAAVIILGLTLASPNRAQTDSTGSSDAPAVEHYKLIVEIDPARHSLIGEADITVKNSTVRPVTMVPALLYRLMDVNAVTDANGRPLQFTHAIVKFPDNSVWQANAVQINLSAPLAPDQTTIIRVRYAGPLFGYREVMAYVRETISEDYSLLRAESMPYPMIGPPSYAGWRRAARSKFDYQIESTVPAGYFTPCIGDQIGEPQTKEGKTVFRCAGPATVNPINVAIARFRVINDPARKLTVYALQADTEAGNRIMNEMRQALDFYTSYFGPPPKIGMMGLHNGLTVIEIPDGWGSYALRGYIFQSAAAFKDPKRAGELYHEVGHLWNPVVADRILNARYFDEAFASYLEALAVRQFEGEQAYRALLDDYRDRFVESANEDPLGKTTAIADYAAKNLGGLSYSKGTWSLYVLHQLLGDDRFKQVIRTFLTEFGENPADFKDFQDVAQRVSRRNLSKYFQEWLYTSVSSQLLVDKVPITDIVKRY